MDLLTGYKVYIHPGTFYEESVCKSKKFKDYYKVSMEPDGENRWLVKNPEGTVGVIKHDNGQYRSMLDGSKIQMYANKANGDYSSNAAMAWVIL